MFVQIKTTVGMTYRPTCAYFGGGFQVQTNLQMNQSLKCQKNKPKINGSMETPEIPNPRIFSDYTTLKLGH